MPKISGIQPWVGLDKEGTYLVLIAPHEIPHLVLVCKGNYFSLTHKKAIVNEEFEPYLKYLQRLAKPLLFCGLDIDLEGLEKVFANYFAADAEQITCFYPVRDALLPQSSAAYIYELIPELIHENIIQGFYHLNMNDILENGDEFTLSVYSKQAIFSYIDELNSKYVSRT